MKYIGRQGIALVILALGCILECNSGNATPTGLVGSWAESNRNKETALKQLWSAFKATRKGGRVYYNTTSCQGDFYPIPFPKIDLNSSINSNADLDTVRELFRNDGRVLVTQGLFGTIRIRIGKISDAILKTNISLLTLTPEEQYNPEDAIIAIENTKEVRAALRKLGIRQVSEVTDRLLNPVEKGLPHLPPSLTNIGMDDALDLVAKTFSGIVVYGFCTHGRLYDLNFTGGYNFDDRTPIIWDQSK